MKAIRVLGGGDREKARLLIEVQRNTMYCWEHGRARIGPDYRKHILRLLKQAKQK
jgi:hypothetical protein